MVYIMCLVNKHSSSRPTIFVPRKRGTKILFLTQMSRRAGAGCVSVAMGKPRTSKAPSTLKTGGADRDHQRARVNDKHGHMLCCQCGKPKIIVGP